MVIFGPYLLVLKLIFARSHRISLVGPAGCAQLDAEVSPHARLAEVKIAYLAEVGWHIAVSPKRVDSSEASWVAVNLVATVASPLVHGSLLKRAAMARTLLRRRSK